MGSEGDRDLALVQAPLGLRGSSLLREGHWEPEREKDSAWVTQPARAQVNTGIHLPSVVETVLLGI